jgi:hypothetical protein
LLIETKKDEEEEFKYLFKIIENYEFVKITLLEKTELMTNTITNINLIIVIKLKLAFNKKVKINHF